MTEDIFERARKCIGEGLVRRMFDSGKSKTDHHKRELKISCPYRTDKKIGNFSVNLDTGLFIDYAMNNESGDFIDLVCRSKNISKLEAAKLIVEISDGKVYDKKEKKKEKPTYEAVIPIPANKLKGLNRHVDGKFIIKKFGTFVSGWIMRMPSGDPWMCVVRHWKDGKKNDVPYSFCSDGKWHATFLKEKNCWLYNCEKIKPDSKILIVEGLKCADVEVPGYVVVSWHGGSGSIKKYDWKIIKDHESVTWPDLDKHEFKDGVLMPKIQQPGMANALKIQDKLSNNKILDVYKRFGTAKPKGWDIYDAMEEGVDLVKFIEECVVYEESGKKYELGGIFQRGSTNGAEEKKKRKKPSNNETDKKNSDVLVGRSSGGTGTNDAASNTLPSENFIEPNGAHNDEQKPEGNVLDNERDRKGIEKSRDKPNLPTDSSLQLTERTESDKYQEENEEEIHESFAPFQTLGFYGGQHYFLPAGSNIVKKIGFGSFTKYKLYELASLSYWCTEYPTKRDFSLDAAVDDLIRQSERKGFFKPDKIRGAGVWFDDKRIVMNNGETLTDENGERLKNFETKFHYVKSEKSMGDFNGRTCTRDEGHKLMELFAIQGFEVDIESLICLGWALMAPLASLLSWRPHVWLTGPRSSGKTWVLENLMHPICGPFTFVGTGSDTAAGLYRALWTDPCPVIKDEMEPGKSKEGRKKIEDTLEVARNASTDFSSFKTVANQHGGVDRFSCRSPFFFSSVVPYMPGGPIESRIIVTRIKDSAFSLSKYEKTKEILKTGLMDDPGMFRRQIFKNVKAFLQNCEIIKAEIMNRTGDKRKSDNFAPIFASLYNLVNDGLITNRKTITEYVDNIILTIEQSSEQQSDEEKLLREIFDYNLRINGNDSISIAELILKCEHLEKGEPDHFLLMRNGVKIYTHQNETKFLAIATDHKTIREKMLRDTIYSGRYVNVLERHVAAEKKNTDDKKDKGHRRAPFCGMSKRAVHLHWHKIKEMYFEEAGKDLENLVETIF